MSKLKIILVGANGRVGQEIESHLVETRAATVVARIDHKNGWKTVGLTKSELAGSVIVDFSTPRGMAAALDYAVLHKVPLVSGTTGISKREKQKLSLASRKIAVLWAPNMSLGVQLFQEIISAFGKNFKDYDLQIEELHHIKKMDSPSGTAIRLQDCLAASTKKKLPPVMAGRGGGIFGIHKLWVMGEEEILTIEHTALNRRVFARGAVTAAQWIQRRRPGLYSMSDVIKNG